MPSVNRRAFFGACAAGAAASSPTAATPVAALSQAPAAGAAAPTPSPEQRLLTLIDGAAVTQMIYVAARTRVADHIGAGSPSVDEIAAATKVHPDSLYRVLRTLAGYGVFEELEGRRFRQTPVSRLLQGDVPRSMRAAAEVRGEDFFWRSWGALRDSVRTGETGHELVFGEDTFTWFARHPDQARLFDDFQASMTAAAATAITKAYPFPPSATVADIGGGNGTLLTAVLGAHPGVKGVLFDLPHVVDAARPRLAAQAARLQFTGGDFFKAVPAGAQIYLMKYIIHDWEESKALAILANTRRAMPGGAHLLVIEDLVCGPNQPCRAKLGDVNMLVRTGGRNRTREEYDALLARGGFRIERAIPAAGDLHILDAVVV
ncbi:MAG TPA: methyltransferase [Luteitalea sp.]|nr:methyltransferase [Luteitalea sp.]